MSTDFFALAHQRARQVVGESVWEKLSDKVRAGAINEELRMLGAAEAGARQPFCLSVKEVGGQAVHCPRGGSGSRSSLVPNQGRAEERPRSSFSVKRFRVYLDRLMPRSNEYNQRIRSPAELRNFRSRVEGPADRGQTFEAMGRAQYDQAI